MEGAGSRPDPAGRRWRDRAQLRTEGGGGGQKWQGDGGGRRRKGGFTCAWEDRGEHLRTGGRGEHLHIGGRGSTCAREDGGGGSEREPAFSKLRALARVSASVAGNP